MIIILINFFLIFNFPAVSCSSSGESAATLPRFSHHGQNSSLDERALITQPKSNRAGMKVNSIYAQDQWHITKDPRLFLNDIKDQSSPFQVSIYLQNYIIIVIVA